MIAFVRERNSRKLLALLSADTTLTAEEIIKLYGLRWDIGVSREGHIVQSVKVRPRPKDSSLIAREAPWRESKTVKPSDNILVEEGAQSTRLQRTAFRERLLLLAPIPG